MGAKRGRAVAYADKGSGNGVHYLQDNTINLIDGVRADERWPAAHRTSPPMSRQRSGSKFNANTPFRLAIKHAHSQVNPDKDWGRDTLRAIEFAFYVLNGEKYFVPLPNGKKRRTILSSDTVVIASSVSKWRGRGIDGCRTGHR